MKVTTRQNQKGQPKVNGAKTYVEELAPSKAMQNKIITLGKKRDAGVFGWRPFAEKISDMLQLDQPLSHETARRMYRELLNKRKKGNTWGVETQFAMWRCCVRRQIGHSPATYLPQSEYEKRISCALVKRESWICCWWLACTALALHFAPCSSLDSKHLIPTQGNWDWLPCSFWQSGMRPWCNKWSAGNLEFGHGVRTNMFFPKGHRVDFNLRSFVLIGISTKCKKKPVALQRCLNWPKSSACFISLTLISGIPSLWEVLAQQLGANRMQKPAGCSRCYLFLEVHVTKLFNHILIIVL